VAQKNTAAVISSLPKIDGIWAQGGTDGVLKAFRSAGRQLPPTCGESENGFRKYLAGMPGFPKVRGLSIGQPPYLSVVALELARAVVKGEHPAQSITIPFPVVTSDSLVPGKTVFPDLPDSFFADFTDSGPNATVVFCQQAATDGKPCPEEPLQVNLSTS
jgi:ribose transport system substrate-binding protein